MKKALFVFAVSILSAAPSFAAESLYQVEPLTCVGKITGDISQVHPSYYQIAVKLTSFLSTTRDGRLVPSLQVENEYSTQGTPVDFGKFQGQEVWYHAPLRTNGKQVKAPGIELNLTILSSEMVNGARIDRLVGTYGRSGSVAGNHGYNLRCTARVVNKPSRIDNNTRH